MAALVSILIPCHNAEPWLAATLESALSQTWPEIEVILVDDGSKDKSLKIAKRYEKSGVTVISQKCHGASHARNRAFEASSGEYIQFLDSDDLLAPDKIEAQMKRVSMETSDCKLLSASWANFNHHIDEATFRKQPVWSDSDAVDWLVSSWEGGGMMHPAAWLVKRSVIKDAGPWNEELSLNDDGEFFTRAILRSGKVVFVEEAKSFYRQGHIGRLSALRTPAAIQSAYDAAGLCAQHLLSVEDSSRTRHASASLIQRFVYTIYPEGGELLEKAEQRVAELGGTNLVIEGGPRFQILRRLIGWKQAKRLQVKWNPS